MSSSQVRKGGRTLYLEDLHVDRINHDHWIHECVRNLRLRVQDQLRLLRSGFLSQVQIDCRIGEDMRADLGVQEQLDEIFVWKTGHPGREGRGCG